MIGARSSRLPFLIAAALVAAGLGDPVVESVSNTGIFGGHYADTNHTGILPTLLAGLIITLEVLLVRLREVWRRAAGGDAAGGLIQAARELAARPFARDLPSVFALQLSALFVLESAEQLALGGKLSGGTVWLGGPILFSLSVHALVGGLCTFALGAGMRALLRFASLVATAVRFIWLAIQRETGAGFCLYRQTPRFACAQAPHVRQIGGRAPPLLPTPI